MDLAATRHVETVRVAILTAMQKMVLVFQLVVKTIWGLSATEVVPVVNFHP